RAGGAERAEIAIDEARRVLPQRGGVESEFPHEAGTQILDDDVSILDDEPAQPRPLLGVLEVDGDAELVAVERLEGRRGAVPERRAPFARIVPLAGILDLDEDRAQLSEHLGGEG